MAGRAQYERLAEDPQFAKDVLVDCMSYKELAAKYGVCINTIINAQKSQFFTDLVESRKKSAVKKLTRMLDEIEDKGIEALKDYITDQKKSKKKTAGAIKVVLDILSKTSKHFSDKQKIQVETYEIKDAPEDFNSEQ